MLKAHLKNRLSILMSAVKYGFVGVLNTLLHAVTFVFLHSIDVSQAISNLIAFLVAVTFSFFANAKFTFRKQPTVTKFFKMTCVMAVLSYAGGWLGDAMQWHYLLTFIAWSAFSFVAGFFLTRFFVFDK